LRANQDGNNNANNNNNNNNNNNAALNPEGADQHLPGQRRGASYVSRLACVKAAIDLHLQRLKVCMYECFFICFVLFDLCNLETTSEQANGTHHIWKRSGYIR
jgi:hypothetical protein